MQESVGNFLILNSVTQKIIIIELTKEYSQIKGTKVSFLEVFQSDQLHHTARKQIKSKRSLSACLFVCLLFIFWGENNFLFRVEYSCSFRIFHFFYFYLPLTMQKKRKK